MKCLREKIKNNQNENQSQNIKSFSDCETEEPLQEGNGKHESIFSGCSIGITETKLKRSVRHSWHCDLTLISESICELFLKGIILPNEHIFQISNSTPILWEKKCSNPPRCSQAFLLLHNWMQQSSCIVPFSPPLPDEEDRWDKDNESRGTAAAADSLP